MTSRIGAMAEPRAVIEYRDVHKSFDVPVLAGIDLTVALGETFGIVGPSGCGKSVLLKTTVGLIKPDRGDVWINGQSVFRSPRPVVDEILRKIGFVFQNAALFDSMTVSENVAFGLHEDVLRRLGKRQVWRRVIRALEDVNLNPRLVVDKLPGELSGGMCKRVGLARAIVGRPQILLYDEPVTGLDPVNTAGVQRLIATIARNLQATSVIVTHDVEGALEICDRVGLMHHGRLRLVATPSEFRGSRDPIVRAFSDRRQAEAASFAVLDD
jgi:phospholipid/cholesterol/gamma-HCH transport system ATP-binding protein